ncbi:MAG: DUF2459 domain-containing protein [Gammaproteobacteria bacterium]|nr:DUF2459 domain-containing protein [Gammaproteobacteria bacterium]
MRNGINRALFVLLSMVLVTCASPPKGLCAPPANTPFKSIWLASHGWHAGIVIQRMDIPADLWPENNDFPDVQFLEVGWGDKDYYMTPDPHIGIMLKAGLLPTESVLHIVGFTGSVSRYFPYSEIIRIDLTYEGFERLVTYIKNSYAMDEAGMSRLLGPGLYGKSRFYLSRETYHAFNTCNVWTARALRDAGCPVTPAATLMVEDLMSKVATFGVLIQAGKPAK